MRLGWVSGASLQVAEVGWVGAAFGVLWLGLSWHGRLVAGQSERRSGHEDASELKALQAVASQSEEAWATGASSLSRRGASGREPLGCLAAA